MHEVQSESVDIPGPGGVEAGVPDFLTAIIDALLTPTRSWRPQYRSKIRSTHHAKADRRAKKPSTRKRKRVEPQSEALRFLRRQSELEEAMRRPGGAQQRRNCQHLQ
jgi:hypothetical protein